MDIGQCDIYQTFFILIFVFGYLLKSTQNGVALFDELKFYK